MQQEGKSIMIAIPAGGCASGNYMAPNTTTPSTGVPVLVGNDMVGIPQGTYAAATSGNVTLHLSGVFSNIKLKTGDTPAVGDKLYFDSAEEELTTTSGGNVLAGWAFSTAVVGTVDTTVAIKLRG